VTAVDGAPTIARCRDLYDFGQWFADNLDEPALDLRRTFDLIVSADVIEHMVDPDRLIEMIKKHSGNHTLIVLSTVERDYSRGFDDNGPSPNSEHAREWNYSEFNEYIRSQGFRIIEHFRCQTTRLENQEDQQPDQSEDGPRDQPHQQRSWAKRFIKVALHPTMIPSILKYRWRRMWGGQG